MQYEVDVSVGGIRLKEIGKAYSEARNPFYRISTLLMGRMPVGGHSVLRGVNLSLEPGSSLGVIGANGAGKSTLLQIIAGTLAPTEGVRRCGGRIGALLELGAGFNPEFTGEENARLACVVMGLTPSEAKATLKEIESFAEIGDAWSRPVKTYSSGMFVRLAFAVSTSVEPDILVVDEALAVGDAVFGRKSFERIMTLREKGVTLVFCTHALYQVGMLCDKGIWIDRGEVRAFGPAYDVVSKYEDHLKLTRNASEDGALLTTNPSGHVLGAADRLAKFRDVILAVDGVEASRGQCPAVRSGSGELLVKMLVEYDTSVRPPSVGVLISDAAGMHVSSCGSFQDGVSWRISKPGELLATVRFASIPLMRGEYAVDVFLLCENGVHVYEHIVHAVKFEVTSTGPEPGIVRLPHQWS